eukprot:334167-Prymnesium_polylepis.2
MEGATDKRTPESPHRVTGLAVGADAVFGCPIWDLLGVHRTAGHFGAQSAMPQWGHTHRCRVLGPQPRGFLPACSGSGCHALRAAEAAPWRWPIAAVVIRGWCVYMMSRACHLNKSGYELNS